MSLNGLDDARIKEAFEAAANEPGGWFLLKYASRDEVELLGRGNGGIVEIRNNIAQHEEPSPLFGYLRYRRRNVLIKYLPEDCSRLVQARVTVHFNALADYFAPIETTFEIATAKELKDTQLSAACSLHAQSGSVSSSTSSLRRRRLMEIAEEEEEEERAKRRSVEKVEDTPRLPTSPVSLNADLAHLPEHSQFADSTKPPSFEGARPPSPAKSLDAAAYRGRPDLYSYSSYPYGKAKVKLGPRPSLENGGRPRTSAGSYRPVANLPAGVKMFRKNSKKGRSQDKENQIEEETEQALLAAADPILDMPPPSPVLTRPHTSGGRPATSSGVSIKPPLALSTKQNTMTPEMIRLMKAKQLREKKKKASAESKEVEPLPRPPPLEVSKDTQPTKDQPETVEDGADKLGVVTVVEKDNETQALESKVASGLEAALTAPPSDDASEDTQEETQTDSHPTSPLGESSEIDDSTKASSLSESTDETVHERHDEKSGSDAKPGDVNDGMTKDFAPGVGQTPPGSDSVEVLKGGSIQETLVVQEKASVNEAAHIDVDDRQTEKADDKKDEETEVSLPVPVSEPVPQASRPTVGEQDPGEGRISASEKAQDDNTTPTPSSIRVPKSKFSTQDLKSARTAVPEIITPVTIDLQDKKPPVIAKDHVHGDEGSADVRRSRKLEPINTDLDAIEKDTGRSEAHLSDDEELLEELQSATVQEARPMLVSKSPMNPVFPANPLQQKMMDGSPNPLIVRTVSNPLRGPILGPGDVSQSSARTVSSGAAYLHKVTQQSSNASLASSKSNIGSSISQRIKALELLSATGGGASPGQQRSERPSSTFFSVRKTSVRDPSRSPSVAERASSLTRNQTPSPPQSRESSPETAKLGYKDRAGSMANRLSMFEGGMIPRGQPDSIQVTARIVRDPSHPFPRRPETRATTTDFGPLDLKQSPLVVDIQRPPSTSPSALGEPAEIASHGSSETIQERREKRRSQSQDGDDDQSKRRSSLTIVRDFVKSRRGSILSNKSTENLGLGSPVNKQGSRSPSRPPSTHQTSSLGRRLSISSRRSDRDGPVPSSLSMSPSAMTEASGSGDDRSDKKSGNLTSRFMRRLSNTITPSRKNITPHISPTLTEEDVAEVAASNASSKTHGSSNLNQPSIVAFMGDVNVQFPDNLLWKRRSLSLDSQGFLILSAVQGATAAVAASIAGGIKRYHLSEFRQPYIPEMEVQELPNSVCLDFTEGSGLQVACGDRAGQMNVLKTLQDAHRGHTSFGQ